MEHDPDIQSRTCSICGYQGKWISEMIRHKRVHTNERPFRCKYCSRTSKWKADLIRHVAKVHNIRVVSKYSRSKTFDSDPNIMRALKEAHGFVEQDFMSDDRSDMLMDLSGDKLEDSSARIKTDSGGKVTIDIPETTESESSWEKYLVSGPSEDGDTIYWCKVCSYETRDIHLFRTHTGKHENKRPFQCSECGYRSNWSSDVYKHIRGRNCGGGLATVVRHSPNSKNVRRLNAESPRVAELKCRLCGFVDITEDNITNHLKKTHDIARFGCGLCKFNSSEKKIVEFHLQFQHQAEPESKIVDHIQISGNPTCTIDGPSSLKRKASPQGTEAVFGGILNKRSKLEKKSSISASSRTSVSSLSFPESPRTVESPELEKHTGSSGKFEETYNRERGTSTGEQNFSAQKTGQAESTGLDLTAESGKSNMPLIKDVSDVMSDFNAILNAAGEDINLSDMSLPIPNYGSVNKMDDLSEDLSESVGHEGSESEAEIEDEEAYIHAGEDALDQGLEFVRQAPKEIQKVSICLEGEAKLMWKCRFCEHTSKRRANVRSHEKKHFKKNPVGLLRCPRCSYRGDKRSLNAHFRVHSDSSMPERFPCSKCPANFRSRINLIKHMEFHGSKNEFQCPSCDYAVKESSHLAEHRRVHSCSDENDNSSANLARVNSSSLPSLTPPKPMDSLGSKGLSMCSTEGNVAFDLRSLLMDKQSKPKRYNCSSKGCFAKFSDSTQLKRHEQYHSNVTNYPHRCSLCNYSVPYAINLIKHLRSHHDIPLNDVAQISKDMQSKECLVSPNSVPNNRTESDMAVPDHEEEDNVRVVTPDGEPGSLKIKITLGKTKC